MNFQGAAKRLDDVDLPRIGARIGVSEDEIHAVDEVESLGTGFDARGRPLILPERHVFYRNLRGERRDRAVAAGLAYPKWGAKPYPRTSDERYALLERMMEIDETAAIMACSWGRYQVLAENFRAAGYDSPQAMVQAMMADEENHLEAMVNFVLSSGLDDELRAHRWAPFAYGYNGAGYAKNQYDVKLDRAYRKWAKIPDTPWESQSTTVLGQSRPVLRRGSTGAHVRVLQQLLHMNLVDGDFGPATEGAVRGFQARAGLTDDGVVGPRTWAALEAARAR